MPAIEIRDAVTIITGASAGIGRAAAMSFAGAGARVALVARDPLPLNEAAAAIRARGGEAVAVPADVTRDDDVARMTASVLERYGRIDILVCNAGVGLYGNVADLEMEDLRRAFEVNYFGVIRCIQAALPAMRRARSGLIQLVSSVIGRRSIPGYSGYCASKFALYALAEALRIELNPDGITVQTVYPALTATGFSANAIRRNPTRSGPPRGMPPEKVAQHMLRAARRGSRDCVITMGGRVLTLANGLAPGLVDAVVARVVKRIDGPPEPS